MRCIEFPKLFACSWLDNKPVYLLTSGVSTRKSSVIRKEKNGASSTVSCPEFVASYNAYMGGVDAHDQLRLQRYSVQRSLRVVKYYKTLFFGLFDIALVNSYILHREYCKNTHEKPMSHAEFRVLLHEQLLDMAASDFGPEVVIDRTIDLGSPHPRLPSVTPHQMQMTEDKQPSEKYRYRVCKVCSILPYSTYQQLSILMCRMLYRESQSVFVQYHSKYTDRQSAHVLSNMASSLGEWCAT
jgi:Transposase IS4